MNEALFLAILGVLAAPLSVFVTWLVNRRKNISDLYKNITEASQTSVDLMQTTMENLADQLASATDKIEELQKEIDQLRRQNLLLLQENHSLHRKIDELMKIVHTGEIPPYNEGDHSSSSAS